MIFTVFLLFIGSILAFWISAICGGGASLILIPILNLIIPTSIVPFSLTIGTFTSSASRIAAFRKSVHWKIFFWFVPFSIPAVLIGAYFIKFINPIYLQIIVAILLIANVPQLFLNKKQQDKEEKPSPKYILALVGFLAGFVSGITGAIGLLFNRFYLKYGLTKEEIIATRAANEIILHIIKLVIYILLGLYSRNALLLGLTIAFASIISSYTVKYILPLFSDFAFRKVGYAAMVISGITLFYSSAQKIIQQDKVQLTTTNKGDKNETALKWRNSDFVLEYSLDGEFEIERPIEPQELPKNLLEKYNKISPNYDKINLEKVFKIGEESYEFYCYKGSVLTKLEF
ncbi:sulfite exporter TauE/SafE family protein [Empedobacter brevis]|uniref:Probable membrane transporter protein n=1 Tax=Empedobacter brevis TaxID=247 RepID=A0AAJ1QCV2_9FLAO|nr:sulfite exporter TauE/SafE family protein [Empedobacter brevis]MDM1071718.1 sulfite exporter TauE/SafE family protein [Empedobacter brevis]QHC85921.1 sulfite transporter TauE/SafE [Empedobacter brevis]